MASLLEQKEVKDKLYNYFSTFTKQQIHIHPQLILRKANAFSKNPSLTPSPKDWNKSAGRKFLDSWKKEYFGAAPLLSYGPTIVEIKETPVQAGYIKYELIRAMGRYIINKYASKDFPENLEKWIRERNGSGGTNDLRKSKSIIVFARAKDLGSGSGSSVQNNLQSPAPAKPPSPKSPRIIKRRRGRPKGTVKQRKATTPVEITSISTVGPFRKPRPPSKPRLNKILAALNVRSPPRTRSRGLAPNLNVVNMKDKEVGDPIQQNPHKKTVKKRLEWSQSQNENEEPVQKKPKRKATACHYDMKMHLNLSNESVRQEIPKIPSTPESVIEIDSDDEIEILKVVHKNQPMGENECPIKIVSVKSLAPTPLFVAGIPRATRKNQREAREKLSGKHMRDEKFREYNAWKEAEIAKAEAKAKEMPLQNFFPAPEQLRELSLDVDPMDSISNISDTNLDPLPRVNNVEDDDESLSGISGLTHWSGPSDIVSSLGTWTPPTLSEVMDISDLITNKEELRVANKSDELGDGPVQLPPELQGENLVLALQDFLLHLDSSTQELDFEDPELAGNDFSPLKL